MSSRENEINNIVRRMVNIPRNILGDFSRAMNQGLDMIGGRRNYHPHRRDHDQVSYSPQHSTFPLQQHPSNLNPPMVQEEWAFLANFERQYGTVHPFFYACRFTDALKIANDEHKLLFMYIHSPEHPFTPSFCRETLCSESVVQFLDTNFVSWGGLANRGDGLLMCRSLKVSSFPSCTVVAPITGDNLAVLQQLEGPVSPAELVEILQRTMDEQRAAFGRVRSTQDEKRMADQRLKEEQDVAYVAALQMDQERQSLLKKSISADRVSKPGKIKETEQSNKGKTEIVTAQISQKQHSTGDKKAEVSQILIRAPNGERREHSFLCTDNIGAVYGYVDSLCLPGVENYRLISNFPRKVYGFDQMEMMSLKEAGLHPKASLFLELL